MSKFKVGEIAIFFNPISSSMGKSKEYLRNEEVEITGDLFPRKFENGEFNICYRILFSNGLRQLVYPSELRKKKPPEYDGYKITTWSKCEWQPKEITA